MALSDWEKALGRAREVSLRKFLELQPAVTKDLAKLKDKRGALRRLCSTMNFSPTEAEFKEALEFVRSV